MDNINSLMPVIVGGIIGIVSGLLTVCANNYFLQKNKINAFQDILIRQLEYSYELFQGKTNWMLEFVSKGTWIFEKNCRDYIKYFNLTSPEMAIILEWLSFLEYLNDEYYIKKERTYISIMDIRRDGILKTYMDLIPGVEKVIEHLKGQRMNFFFRICHNIKNKVKERIFMLKEKKHEKYNRLYKKYESMDITERQAERAGYKSQIDSYSALALLLTLCTTAISIILKENNSAVVSCIGFIIASVAYCQWKLQEASFNISAIDDVNRAS